MSGKFGLTMAASLLSLLLVACGGDSGSSPLAGPGNNNGGGGDDDGGQVTAGSINLLSDSPQIGTAANSQVTLTATVQDSNGILLPAIPVTFSTSGAALQVVSAETDTNGNAQAILTNSSNPQNRTISVTATAGGQTDTVSVQAIGTDISISGPTAVSIGATASYTVRLTDSNGNGISGEAVTVSSSGSNTLTSASQTTSATGTVSLGFTANTGGTDTITVSAYTGSSTVQASIDVQVDQDSFLFNDPDPTQIETVDLNTPETVTVVLTSGGAPVNGETITFSATRGALSATQVSTANGEASVNISSSTAGPSIITATTTDGLTATRQIEFVATNPTSLIIQANDTQLNPQQETEVTAVLRDSQNNLVKGQPVTFSIVTDESNGQLLESQATTDSLGRATVTYRAGNSGTGNNGVVIQAQTSAGTQPSSTISMTVGGQALRITLGTGNEIIEPDSVRYDREWVAFVTDVNGAPVSGANVELKLLPISYGKGFYVATDIDGDGEPDQWVPNRTATCDAEDLNNGNGIIDPGEDLNNNGKLDPSNDATFSPATLTTAADGSAGFSLLYPQSNCSWADFRLTATVEVAGSESQGTAEFTLSCSASDLNNIEASPPGGSESKYGSAAICSDPN